MKAFSFEKEETVTDRGMLEWNVRVHTKYIFQIWFIFLFCFWMVIIPWSFFCLSFNIDEVHCMAESVWKAEHHTHNFRSMGINLSQLLSSFYSTSMLNRTAGICFRLGTRASVRPGTDFGLAVGVPDHWTFRSGLRAGQSSFSAPDSLNHFYFMDLALCTYVVVKLEQKSIFQKLLQESLRHMILWNSTIWWSLHFVFA